MAFASTFVVGAVTVPFGAIVNGLEDKGGALRELSISWHVLTELDWNNFRQLNNWSMDIIPMPWGNTVEVLVKGGPGAGTLTIPGLTPPIYTAYLADISRTWYNGRTGHSTGKARFIFTTG